MSHGKQLRLFLPDGAATGPRYYELVNWTGQGLVMPASRIRELASGGWPEFERPGVYFVRGQSEEGHPRLYIGESENVAKRVQGHPSGLGFEVSEILLFSSKDENLTKSHVLWLEIQLIQRAVNAKRTTVTNTKRPDLKLLSKAEQATMEEFVQHVELVAQTAGYPYFRKAAERSGETILPQYHMHKQKAGLHASAVINEEGFVVLAGSRASSEAKPTLAKGYAQQREELIDQGVLRRDEDGHLTFTVDAPFTASSAAASIIAGHPSAGPSNWKTPDGKTLGEVQAAEDESRDGMA